jgi:hypothetical protein
VRYDRFKFNGNIDESDGTMRLDIPFEDTSGKVSLYGGVEVPLDRRGQCNFVGEAGTRNSEFDFNFFPNLNEKGYEQSCLPRLFFPLFVHRLARRVANQLDGVAVRVVHIDSGCAIAVSLDLFALPLSDLL